MSSPTDPGQEEAKSEQAGDAQQDPLGLFEDSTIGLERKTGKDKATVTGLEVTRPAFRHRVKQTPLLRTGGNSSSAFRLQRNRIHIARYGVSTLCTVPQE